MRLSRKNAAGLAAGLVALATLAAAPEARAQAAAACPVKIGGVLPLTGTMGAVGKNIANSAQLAIRHINEGGGIKGCPVQFVLRDDQGQPNVGVDAAKYLIDVEHVAALTAGVSSGVTVPIVTSVTAAAKIPQISCCSSAPILTTLAREGKTGGFFFRTFPAVKNQSYPPAKLAAGRGYKRIAVIYVNTDYGISLHSDFARAMARLGGSVVKGIAYNENQGSYRAEVSAALAEKPDALFLVSFPQDGATIVREWISLGGTQNLILNNALRSPDFVKAVGSKYLQKAFGTDIAPAAGSPATAAFKSAYESAYKGSADGPGIQSQYDAVMALGLAMNIAPNLTGPAIRDAMRKIHASGGSAVATGPAEFRKALAFIKAGTPIKYTGATGPIEFDAYGDVGGAVISWRVHGTELEIDKSMSLEEVHRLFKEIDG